VFDSFYILYHLRFAFAFSAISQQKRIDCPCLHFSSAPRVQRRTHESTTVGRAPAGAHRGQLPPALVPAGTGQVHRRQTHLRAGLELRGRRPSAGCSRPSGSAPPLRGGKTVGRSPPPHPRQPPGSTSHHPGRAGAHPVDSAEGYRAAATPATEKRGCRCDTGTVETPPADGMTTTPHTTRPTKTPAQHTFSR
jgi:hypothetical protein